MLTKLLLVFLAVTAVSECKRPPWYKPCWVYLCGMDVTDPVCAWDPHRGSRLFRNSCEMDRHNFCYNRNYAIVDADNNVEQDMKLCGKLKDIVDHGEEKPSLVRDGNVRVHFLEDPNTGDKRRSSEAIASSYDSRYRQRQSLYGPIRSHGPYGYRGATFGGDHFEKRFKDDESYSGE